MNFNVMHMNGFVQLILVRFLVVSHNLHQIVCAWIIPCILENLHWGKDVLAGCLRSSSMNK
jgi:hypothetical protein